MLKLFFKSSFILIILFSVACNNSKNIVQKSQIIGVKVYDTKFQNIPEMFDDWKTLGINTVFADTSFFNIQEFSKLAKENNIKTFAIVPTFYNPDYLKKHPASYAITSKGEIAKEDWVEFVCPSNKDYIKYHLNKINKIVQDFKPDGLSIDFIRHFLYWEMIYPDKDPNSLPNTCLCENCMKEFQQSCNISIPDEKNSPELIYAWINAHYKNEWINWKCGIITKMVNKIVHNAKIIKPDIIINLHVVPFTRNDFGNAIKYIVGQDLKSLSSYVDYFSPMTYSHMVKREPGWVNLIVNDVSKISGRNVLPSIQVSREYLSEKVSGELFKKNLQEALKKPSGGVVFWSWEKLKTSPEKFKIVRELIANYR